MSEHTFFSLPEDVKSLVRQYTPRVNYVQELHDMFNSVKDYQIYRKERVELLLNKIKQKWSTEKLLALQSSFWTSKLRLRPNPTVKQFTRVMGSDGFERVGVIFND